jgi:signal transduction histidine kinase
VTGRQRDRPIVRASTIDEVRLAMDEAVRLVAEGLQADVTQVMEPIEGSESFRVVAGQGGQPETLRTLEYTPEEVPLVDLARRSERPVSSSDGLATAIGDGHRHFGVLAAHWKTSRKFDQRAIAFIQQVANLLALAIGRSITEARLAESEQRYRRIDELQRVAVLDDRARIARDLHDGIIQSLFAASMVVNQVRELEEMPNTTRTQLVRLERLISSSIEDLRRYVRDLTPTTLSNSDLGTLIRQLVRDFQERTGIRCRLSLEPGALATVQAGAVDIVQIIRESLSNIARHASASTCAIKLRRDGERTTLEIRDNGRGLQRGQRRGLGLKNIVSRARFLGGEAAVTGEPGAGTVVRVILPQLDRVPLRDGLTAWGASSSS